MKDLGQKQSEMYDSPKSPESQKNRIVYPDFSVPLSFIEGMNIKVDDNVDIHFKGRVSGIEDTKWSQRVSFEAKEGEVKKAGKKGSSLLKEA